MSNTVGAVPDSIVPPLGAASRAVITTTARQSCSCSGCHKIRLDLIIEPRGDLGRSGHPAGQVGFETKLVDVTVVVRFASYLEHDLSSSACVALIGEEDVGCIPDAKGALSPDVVLGNVPHSGGTKKMNSSIVRPLNMVELCAIDLVIATVVEVVVIAHQSNVMSPLEGLLGPLDVGLVSSVSSKTSSDVEEGAVGDGVLVIVSVVEGEDLPSQTSATSRVVPTQSLTVEDGLGESEPLRLVCRRVGELELGGRHGSHTPEGLIIVSE